MNASLQQMATHGAQLQKQQQAMMQQMAMLSMNQQPRQQLNVTTPAPLTIPQEFPKTIAPPVPQYQTYMQPLQQPQPYKQQQQYPQHQQYNQQRCGGGYGSRSDTSGRGRGRAGISGQGYNNEYNGRGGGYGGYNNVPMPYVGGAQMVQYTQRSVPSVPNLVKYYANQNDCFSCGFDIEDRNTSATCVTPKPNHQAGFTWANYKQYEQVGHQFSKKGMHKTIYPNM